MLLVFIIFCTFIRAAFKLTKQRDEMLWSSALGIAKYDTSDSVNGKINYRYASNWKGKTSIAKSFKKHENCAEEKKIGKSRKFEQK